MVNLSIIHQNTHPHIFYLILSTNHKPICNPIHLLQISSSQHYMYMCTVIYLLGILTHILSQKILQIQKVLSAYFFHIFTPLVLNIITIIYKFFKLNLISRNLKDINLNTDLQIIHKDMCMTSTIKSLFMLIDKMYKKVLINNLCNKCLFGKAYLLSTNMSKHMFFYT